MLCTGTQAFLQMLADAGVRHIFGNPGTTELPLVDEMALDHRLQYILGLQEVAVMAMADGYAMAGGQLGVVNLHISCGLGNGMGMLYNAYREGTPLFVTAGQQDRRLIFEEPILGSDMVAVARPWTKYAVEVQRLADLPAAMRRAMQMALAPPTGPVFLSLPIDLQSEIGDLDLTPAALLDTRVRPPLAALRHAAEVLAGAKNPGILVGSRTLEADAVEGLVRVAELLGAPAMSESGTTHGRLGFPADHPLSAPGLPLWSPEVRERLAEYDVLFVVGMDLLRQYVYHEPSRAIPEHVRIVHLDPDPYQLGKNYPLEVGLVGDLQAGLDELGQVLDTVLTVEDRASATARAQKLAEHHERLRSDLLVRAEKSADERPLAPLTLMSTLAKILPPDVAVVEEAVTTTSTYFERLGALKNCSGYFGHRGWALGWGLGCSIGVQLAWPDRPVLALLGEGAALYGIQGLWSAAKYNLPVTFVICNNAQYQILKVGAGQLGLPAAQQGRYMGLDLTEPEVDLVSIARSFGVEARRVTEPDELAVCVSDALRSNRPHLIDVPIRRTVPSALAYS